MAMTGEKTLLLAGSLKNKIFELFSASNPKLYDPDDPAPLAENFFGLLSTAIAFEVVNFIKENAEVNSDTGKIE